MYSHALLGKVKILVSEVTIAECNRLDFANDPNGTGKDDIDAFFDNEFIKRMPLSSRESKLAAQIVRDYLLESCDAMIVATAAIHASILYTTDGCNKKRRASQGHPTAADGKIAYENRPLLPIKCPSAAEYLKSNLFQVDTTKEQAADSPTGS